MHTKDNVLALRLGIGSVILALSVALTSGFAAAKSDNGQGDGDGPPANVTQCQTMWQQLGFKNQGQCVASFNHENEGNGYGGHGYGGEGHHKHHHFDFPFNIGAFESWVAQFFTQNSQGQNNQG